MLNVIQVKIDIDSSRCLVRQPLFVTEERLFLIAMPFYLANTSVDIHTKITFFKLAIKVKGSCIASDLILIKVSTSWCACFNCRFNTTSACLMDT